MTALSAGETPEDLVEAGSERQPEGSADMDFIEDLLLETSSKETFSRKEK